MTSTNSTVAGSPEADFQNIITDLLGPDAGQPVCEAIRQGSEQRVRTTSLHLQGASTISPKKEAIIEGRADFLRILLEVDNTISEDLVAVACQRKDLPCVRTLLDFGWPINKTIYSAASLLCFAVNDENFMRQLIEQGADVNATSNLDEPVLAIAIAYGSMKVVSLLLEQGADIMHGNLLHCAAEREDQHEGAQIVEQLVQQGADVNAYRHNNPVARRLRGLSKLLTPLHVACGTQNIPVVRALLRHGADPNRMAFKAGQLVPPTALEKARQCENEELCNLLLGVGS
ncbi:ankyrin [Lepidopterella palustris CBS 459.81]|uniref:Ankyrin n=1 Tax=Lepidopterella palustris CBS 459.81 TaxID=1314670 RepID=A0A8E2DYI0_9PEZI|nr:ankyrin [Lepidopterella palustris CBS 459.81]